MIIGTFIVYFVLFIVVFSFPGLRNTEKEKSNTLFKFVAIPTLFGVGMVFLSVFKVYFIFNAPGLIPPTSVGTASSVDQVVAVC